MKKLLALLMAISLTFQLVTPVFAEELEETQTATEAVEMETEAPATEIPTTEPTTTDAMETAAPEETSAPTEPQLTTEVTEATETTASTEETTAASTEPTEETTEPTLDLLSEDENVLASGECGADGDNLTWVLTQDGTLTISGSGSMRGYSIDDEQRTTAPWGAYWEQLTALVLEPGVTSIGEWAFYHCGSLVNVAIPESVTSIDVSAFRSCSSLTSVTIPDSVTSIGAFAFESCEKLTSVTIPDSVTSICRSAFQACSSLKSVTIPDSVTSIGGLAFADCHSLTSVTIPDSVTSIDEGAFCGCNSLRGIFTSDRNSNYTSVDGVLFDKGCTTLINYPAGHNGTAYQIPEGVTSIGRWSFGGCSRLKSVTIPKGVMSIGSAAFLGCSSLTSVTIPEGVMSIGDSAFHSCSSLTSVTILEGVTSIGGLAFFYCRKLSKLWLPKTVTFIDYGAFFRCDSLKNVYYGGSNSEWNAITIEDDNSALKNAERTYGVTETPGTEIQPVGTTTLTSGGKVTLTAWAMPDNKKIKANWSLSEDSKAYAAISSSGVLTAKTVSEVQNITVIATPTDGSPEARKEIQILPKITVKQAEKFNLFYGNGRAKLAITGGQVASARFVEPSDFVLDNNDGQFYIRLAEGASAKPKTKVTLEITLPGCETPIKQPLTIATTNAAPKLKLNPTASIVNTTLTSSLTVETAILGTEDTLTARSATKGVTASADNGILTLTLDTRKTTTATIYLKGSDWAKEIKLTHRITVTEKKPTVKFTAKGKLDVLNPASEIVYTPKLTNATGTITGVQLTGEDAKLFNAEVVDGLVHLKLAKSGENYFTKKTYKVTPVVTLLGKDITGPTLSIKVTQGAMKLAKLPNLTVHQSQATPLSVKLAVTSPANAKIRDVQLNAKTTTALRNALDAAGDIGFEADTVTFPASTFASLKPGRYTVILDVFPSNAAIDTKPNQARFTLTVQK